MECKVNIRKNIASPSTAGNLSLTKLSLNSLKEARMHPAKSA